MVGLMLTLHASLSFRPVSCKQNHAILSLHSALRFNHLVIQNKPHITAKHGFCSLSGYKVFMAHLNESLNGCCWTILSLFQFLFFFENNRITKFSFPEKAVLITQSFMN